MAMVTLRVFIFGLLSIVIAACSSEGSAPIANAWNTVDSTQTEHRVQPGETIYTIAWRYNMSDQNLIQWNHLQAPYYVSIGQTIRLTPPPESTAQPIAPTPAFTPVQTTSPPPVGTGTWPWPLKGNVLETYDQNGNKGIDIAAPVGTEVKAVQSGTVVYAGSNLHGYGKLLIIKQKEDLMTAYAHNSKLLVSEGNKVTAGQVIALSGDSEAKQAMLHFEVRQAGKPVDPMRYLSA